MGYDKNIFVLNDRVQPMSIFRRRLSNVSSATTEIKFPSMYKIGFERVVNSSCKSSTISSAASTWKQNEQTKPNAKIISKYDSLLTNYANVSRSVGTSNSRLSRPVDYRSEIIQQNYYYYFIMKLLCVLPHNKNICFIFSYFC